MKTKVERQDREWLKSLKPEDRLRVWSERCECYAHDDLAIEVGVVLAEVERLKAALRGIEKRGTGKAVALAQLALYDDSPQEKK